MSNHLKNQSSPYLLQHAENPVNWYPWSEEAFEKAKREDKPIFLSIGYSTCHWCHVMAHESFENEEVAEILNRNFVAIKVDREERPDIDSVYMEVCQALTGSGGWPMSIFMTAEQKPFYAGTYFPPDSRYGIIGFRDLLLAIAEKWKTEKDRLMASAEQILLHIENGTYENQSELDLRLPQKAAKVFAESFDRTYGGFGRAPKFPVPHNLLFLTLYSQIHEDREAFSQVRLTLESMRRGGIFDQIGDGFSRYSTDEYFLVPHFEKMLYDNALLIAAYSAAYKASDQRLFLDTAEKTAEYIFREMTGPTGEFYSAQDADSEGEEGKYYVWAYEEILHVLGREKGEAFCRYFNVTEKGNFEGRNILNLLHEQTAAENFDEEKKRLYEYRKSRAELHLDDKVLTSWNSLMICAMAVLYRVTGAGQYLSAAERAYQFIEENLTDGTLLYVGCRGGVRLAKGFLDDYAYYGGALISLYEVTSKLEYLKRAGEIIREAMSQFADQAGGYFLYGAKNSSLITRPKETYDGALPSGNSMMAYCLVRLSQLMDEAETYREAAEKQLAFLSAEAQAYPTGHSMFLLALLFYANPPQKITAVLSGYEQKAEVLSRLPLYADIKIWEQETAEYPLLNGRTTYYVCKDHRCLPPTNELPSSSKKF